MRLDKVSPASFTFYREPVLAVDGKMQYLFDHTGKRYLDFISGISTVGLGHCHPRITEAMKAQMDKLQHVTTIYLNDQHSLFAEELTAKLPEGIDTVYFTSSGSEANALATQFARLHTKNWSLMHVGNGYHGHGGSAHLTNMSPYNHEIPKTQGVEIAPFPDMYRSPFPIDEAPRRYADMMKQSVDYATSG
jgi:alanine-glyoxylate transaminase/(R)-3-amino-2-methylpropionate-pyruvate transaminase